MKSGNMRSDIEVHQHGQAEGEHQANAQRPPVGQKRPLASACCLRSASIRLLANMIIAINWAMANGMPGTSSGKRKARPRVTTRKKTAITQTIATRSALPSSCRLCAGQRCTDEGGQADTGDAEERRLSGSGLLQIGLRWLEGIALLYVHVRLAGR